MELIEPIKEHDVVDYDFMFVGGGKLTITLDTSVGDSIEELPDRYILNTAARPNFIDPDESIDAETVQVFKGQLTVMATCARKQRMPTNEEKLEMQKFVHGLAKSVQ